MNTMNHSNINLNLTYDDIQLVPRYSEVESRKNIDLTTQLTTNYSIAVPLVASCMDTVCEADMAIAMAEMGGIGCIHRFMTIDDQMHQVATVADTIDTSMPVMAAVGANGDYLERAHELVDAGVNIILIDVAHGHHTFVKNAISQLKAMLPDDIDIIAGNVATAGGAIDLAEWGADGVRVGVGGGSLCTTRIRTGFGVPNISSILQSTPCGVPVMADGGIRTSGDIAKALAVGASTVMLGSLLAGTKEAPGSIVEKSNGLYKRYRGAASLETKTVHGQEVRNVEGESTVVPFKGGVKFVVEGLLDGIRSALSYAGASNLTDFHPEFIQVSAAGAREASPHLIY